MTPNAKLDALIARIEGGEKFGRKLDGDISIALRLCPTGKGWNRCKAPRRGTWTRNDHSPWRAPRFSSFDAIMSLARNPLEAGFMFNVARQVCHPSEMEGEDLKALDFNPEPVLRAMLIQALNARVRRT